MGNTEGYFESAKRLPEMTITDRLECLAETIENLIFEEKPKSKSQLFLEFRAKLSTKKGNENGKIDIHLSTN